MSRKVQNNRGKLRSLAGTKPRRNGGKNANGSPRGGVMPAFRSGGPDQRGYPILLTRTGQRVDLRTYAGRRFVTLVASMADDLGGDDNLSTMEALLVHRAAALALDLEYQEAQALHDQEPLDPHIHRMQASTLRSILATLGLKRRSRDKLPTLKNIIDGTTTEVEHA